MKELTIKSQEEKTNRIHFEALRHYFNNYCSTHDAGHFLLCILQNDSH